MSPGKGPLDLANIWITRNFVALKYLASLTPPSNDESSVYVEFKEQLMRDDEDWYKIGLAMVWRSSNVAQQQRGKFAPTWKPEQEAWAPEPDMRVHRSY